MIYFELNKKTDSVIEPTVVTSKDLIENVCNQDIDMEAEDDFNKKTLLKVIMVIQ